MLVRLICVFIFFFFFFQAEDGIRDYKVTGVQTCALPIWCSGGWSGRRWRSGCATRGWGLRPRSARRFFGNSCGGAPRRQPTGKGGGGGGGGAGGGGGDAGRGAKDDFSEIRAGERRGGSQRERVGRRAGDGEAHHRGAPRRNPGG